MAFEMFISTIYGCTKPLQNRLVPVSTNILRLFSSHATKESKIASKIVLQVIGTGSCGTSKSLTVLADSKRYLFNCGEGTVRLLCEHDVACISNCFITHKSLENISGLPTLTKIAGNRNCVLHGPPNIESLFTTANGFPSGLNMKINKTEHFHSPFHDDLIEIEFVQLFSKQILNNFTDHRHSKLTSKSKKKVKTEMTEKKSQVDVSIAYICKPHSLQENLGFDKSTTTKKWDNFIIIECPTEDFIDSLVENQEFTKFEECNIIIHFTPNDVLKHPKYMEWMSRFSLKTHHLIINECSNGLGNVAAYQQQYKLNLIDPEMFPLLKTHFDSDQVNLDVKNALLAQPLMQYFIRPKLGFINSKSFELQPQLSFNDAYWADMKKNYKKALENINCQDQSDNEYPHLTILGSGSSFPTETRSQSCLLLRINEKKCVLLDCGEGSYGQILRFYGSNETANILTNLSAIFISHLHPDHFMGLGKILVERQRLLAETKLCLLAPHFINDYLKFCRETSSVDLSRIKLVSNFSLCYGHRQLMNEDYRHLLSNLDLLDICTVKVDHSIVAFGVSLTLKNGFQLVYSGDTKPCNNLMDIGKNCTLLIHEATLPEASGDDQYHSTISEAIDASHSMEAKYTILTHFGSRHGPLPAVNSNNIGIAFDNMKVSIGKLPVISSLKPMLEIIFQDKNFV